MSELCNGYAKGQKTYPEMVQKTQSLLAVWEGEKTPVHGSNKGLNLFNAVNDGDDGGGADVIGNTQASCGRASSGGTPETHQCY